MCKKALMSISSQQMGSTRMGSTTNLDVRTWAQRTHETQEEQLKQKVPVAEKEKHTSYRNSICRTSFWWVSTVANLIVTWYFEPARSSTNSVECHHHKTNGGPSWKPISRSDYYRQQWLIQPPLSPLTPHMISCLRMYETRFFSYKGDFTWSFYISQLKRKQVNICIPRSACRSSIVQYWQHLQLPKGSPRKINISPTCLDVLHCQSHFHLPSYTASCKAQGYRIGTSARESWKSSEALEWVGGSKHIEN